MWFPGLYCPGLIEARQRAPLAHQGGEFPGLYCPGLIEAAFAAARPALRILVSGALLPRPH